MLFSQRKGLKPIKSIMQIESMDDDLRNGLWNVLYSNHWKDGEDYYGSLHSNITILCRRLWEDYFKEPIDIILPNDWPTTYNELRTYFFKCQWYEVYDFIEFCAQNDDSYISNDFIKDCNKILEREMSAYRFVDKEISQMTDEQEIKAIEEALIIPDKFKGVKIHLKAALEKLSDRKTPDYRNSIKESISAVESAVNIIAGEKCELGKALKKMEEKSGAKLHPALRGAFDKLYGYTSDAEGIRHSLLDESSLDFEDAKFMLVSCSAFINYLIGKSKS